MILRLLKGSKHLENRFYSHFVLDHTLNSIIISALIFLVFSSPESFLDAFLHLYMRLLWPSVWWSVRFCKPLAWTHFQVNQTLSKKLTDKLSVIIDIIGLRRDLKDFPMSNLSIRLSHWYVRKSFALKENFPKSLIIFPSSIDANCLWKQFKIQNLEVIDPSVTSACLW